ncbi:MAG: hypothetical protein ACQEXG_07900 [Pseudomonadota bacterium]
MKIFNHKAQATALLSAMLMLGVSMSSHALSPQAAIRLGLMDPNTEISMVCNDGTVIYSTAIEGFNMATVCSGHGGPCDQVGGCGGWDGPGIVGGVSREVSEKLSNLRIGNQPVRVHDVKERRRSAPAKEYNSSRSNKPSE